MSPARFAVLLAAASAVLAVVPVAHAEAPRIERAMNQMMPITSTIGRMFTSRSGQVDGSTSVYCLCCESRKFL